MTLDEAIEERLKVIKVQEKLYEESYSDESKEIIKNATDNDRQLADWLTELKDLREENKVLMQECDRLIKEKGELLSKVSGGDVLRICQLEEQLKNFKEEYANLNKISYGFYKELKEAKRLLKAAVEDLNATVAEVYNGGVICECCKWESQIGECCCPSNGGCDADYRWRYADEAKNLLNDEK